MEQIPWRAAVRRAQLSLMNSRELDRLLEIVALMEQTLPGDDAIRSYLYHANPTLQGEKPIDLLIHGGIRPGGSGPSGRSRGSLHLIGTAL